MEALREAVDVGAESDSLDDAADFDLHTLIHRWEACLSEHDCTHRASGRKWQTR
jgi:hypothetical protein